MVLPVSLRQQVEPIPTRRAAALRSLREHFRVDINTLLTGEAAAIGALQGAITQTNKGDHAIQIGSVGGRARVKNR